MAYKLHFTLAAVLFAFLHPMSLFATVNKYTCEEYFRLFYAEQMRLEPFDPIAPELLDKPGCYRLSVRVDGPKSLTRTLINGGIRSRASSEGTFWQYVEDLFDPIKTAQICLDHANSSIVLDPITGKEIPPWSPAISTSDRLAVLRYFAERDYFIYIINNEYGESIINAGNYRPMEWERLWFGEIPECNIRKVYQVTDFQPNVGCTARLSYVNRGGKLEPFNPKGPTYFKGDKVFPGPRPIAQAPAAAVPKVLGCAGVALEAAQVANNAIDLHQDGCPGALAPIGGGYMWVGQSIGTAACTALGWLVVGAEHFSEQGVQRDLGGGIYCPWRHLYYTIKEPEVECNPSIIDRAGAGYLPPGSYVRQDGRVVRRCY